jgi:hypothetical protein
MITIQEQKDLFYNKYSTELLDLYRVISENCDKYKLPILNNEKQNNLDEFIDLILENVNLKQMFLSHYKNK